MCYHIKADKQKSNSYSYMVWVAIDVRFMSYVQQLTSC